MSDIQSWLETQGLGKYGKVLGENDVDLDVLPELTDAELCALGMSLDHRKTLLEAASKLARTPTRASRE